MNARALTTFILMLLAATMGAAQTPAASNAARICGTYLVPSPNSSDTVKVKVVQAKDGSYQGMIIGSNRPYNADGSPRTDLLNPDPAKRGRKLGGIALCWGLRYDGKAWEKGRLYNPNNGKTYDMKCKPISGSRDLDARYYVGVATFGASVRWIYVGQ